MICIKVWAQYFFFLLAQWTFYCIFVSMTSNENMSGPYIEVFCLKWITSLLLLSSFSLTFKSAIVIYPAVDLFEFILLRFIWLLRWYINTIHHIWGVFSHYFFKYYSYSHLFSSSEPHIMHILIHLVVNHKSLRLFAFFYSFCLLFLKLNNLTWSTFKFTALSSNWRLWLYSKFFTSLILLSHSRISIF